MLINSGADVTAKNLDGATALHYLARISSPEDPKQFVELLKLMLRKGAAVNEVNRHHETPLHQAAMKGATLAVEFLVSNKAEPNMQNEFGETALHYAVRLGAVKCIELLLAANADVFLEGEREEGSALTLAEMTKQDDILAMMKRSSSYVEHVKKYGDRSLKSTLRGGVAGGSTSSKNLTESGTPAAPAAKTAPPAALAAGARTSAAATAAAPNAAGGGAAGGRQSAPATHGHAPPLSRGTPAPAATVSAESTIGNVAFGVARGACSNGCDCGMYRWDSQAGGGGPCLNCGHFPAAHAKQSQAEGSSEPSAADDEMRRLESVLGVSVADLSHSWSIDKTELKLEHLLGEGTAARVYKGKYRGQEVAVKVLKESLDPTQMADFTKEFQIYADLRSPHVVLFFGACLRPELCMVFEFCSRGTLFDVLNSVEELDWPRVLKLSQDIAKALNTLHSWVPPIVHRDMKSLNLLVDSNWTIKVRRVLLLVFVFLLSLYTGVGLWAVSLHVWLCLESEHAGQAAGNVRLFRSRSVFRGSVHDQGGLLLGGHHLLGAGPPRADGAVRHAVLRVSGAGV